MASPSFPRFGFVHCPSPAMQIHRIARGRMYGSMIRKPPITPAVENERARGAGSPFVQTFDLADNNFMISAVVSTVRLAFKCRERVRQKRQTELSAQRREPAPFFPAGACKPVRKLLLILAQNIDGELPRLCPSRETRRIPRDAE